MIVIENYPGETIVKLQNMLCYFNFIFILFDLYQKQTFGNSTAPFIYYD